jgi:hypothetical protein
LRKSELKFSSSCQSLSSKSLLRLEPGLPWLPCCGWHLVAHAFVTLRRNTLIYCHMKSLRPTPHVAVNQAFPLAWRNMAAILAMSLAELVAAGIVAAAAAAAYVAGQSSQRGSHSGSKSAGGKAGSSSKGHDEDDPPKCPKCPRNEPCVWTNDLNWIANKFSIDRNLLGARIHAMKGGEKSGNLECKNPDILICKKCLNCHMPISFDYLGNLGQPSAH